MPLETHPASTPGGIDRDDADFERLRHARDRHLGFHVGKYHQPAPMLFTRDGHNVFLGDMYRGHAAFLICSGPSLLSHDLSQLDQRGILTLAVNNAAVVHRPQLWCSVDEPGHFCDAIWYDPGLLKFVPLCHMEKPILVRDENDRLVPSEHHVGDMPGVFGFRRNEAFVAAQWLYEDTFNWGNHGRRTDDYGNRGSRSVMYIALRLLFYLGVRRVFLLGCDFRMEEGKQNYAFDQGRSAGSVRGNNTSYRALNVRLGHLLPYFEKEGFAVFNCTPNSGLTVFPHVPYEEAIDQATSIMPRKIITRGMYDGADRVDPERAERRSPDAASTDLQRCRRIGGLRSVILARSEDLRRAPIEFTTLVGIDDEHVAELRLVWPTWQLYRPEILSSPLLFLCDAARPLEHWKRELAFVEHNQVQIQLWHLDGVSQRHKMLSGLVHAPQRYIKTPWYLKLDTDTAAVERAPWLQAEWFLPNDQGREPVFIASPWGYTKPPNAIDVLDDWADGVPELREFPRLNLHPENGADCVPHPRITSWCFFGRTDWTAQMAAMAGAPLPVTTDDTFLFYCAARTGAPYRRVAMRKLGWQHISRRSALEHTCRAAVERRTRALSL